MRMQQPWPTLRRADLAIAGAGIVGLAIALEGVRRGLKVVVVEQDVRPSGASVRNFGHSCVTAQSGVGLDYALAGRERWLALREEAGIWVQESGTVVAARSDEEWAVLREFFERRPGQSLLLDPDSVRQRVPISAARLVGGAFLPFDLRVDPRQAVPALAAHLAGLGVELHFRTTATGASSGVLHTARGDILADAVVLAVGHDLDRLLPSEAEQSSLTRCSLHMLRIAAPGGKSFGPALLTGTSLLRYSGFLDCPSSPALRERLELDQPELLEAGVNHMLTQHPSGDLLVGDTHHYDHTPSPFAQEELDNLLLSETRTLLGEPNLTVRERWQGTYAWAPDREFFSATPAPGVRALAITSGIGMTTALGLAPVVLDDLAVPDPSVCATS